MRAVTRFFHDEEGGTAIEYTFLASLIGMAALAAMTAVGSALQSKFQEISTLFP